MDNILILNCSSDLGNCCKSAGMRSIMGITNHLLSLIQLIVPIILLTMVAFNLMQLLMDPDDKKKLSALKNRFIAAIIVFMVPVFLNATLSLLESSTNSFDIISCLKETKNIKVGGNVVTKEDFSSKKKKMLPSSKDYEVGVKDNSASPIYSQELPNGPISTTCTVADSSVKLVPNDSNRTINVVGKANGLEVAAYAKSWIGKMSYNLSAQGELKVGGTCSCSHFVYQVLKHFNIVDRYGRSTVWGSCNVKGSTMYRDKMSLVPGDVLFWTYGNAVGHVEIYIGNGQSVGCNEGHGVTLATPTRYASAIHLSAYD